MNRPEARNALSGEMLAIMSDAWDRVNEDPEIRVCILTGAGGYFCAGMDLKAADKKPPSEASSPASTTRRSSSRCSRASGSPSR